jgi:PilZ domain
MPPAVAAALTGVMIFCLLLGAFRLITHRKPPRVEAPTPMNRRKVPRVPVNSEIDLYYQDIDASHKAVRARGIEISEKGASVRCSKPIHRNSIIYLRARQINFEGPAIVRRCTRKGLHYEVGVELQGPLTKNVGLGA